MTTKYQTIYDLFLQRIKDWKLDALYSSSVTSFETYLKGFLVLSVPLFTPLCNQSLARNDTTSLFTEDLNDDNKEILSLYMVNKWFEKEVQNITQINMALQDRDFKRYSESQNLKTKNDYLAWIEEQISQRVVEYQWLGFTGWDSWNNNDFSGE